MQSKKMGYVLHMVKNNNDYFLFETPNGERIQRTLLNSSSNKFLFRQKLWMTGSFFNFQSRMHTLYVLNGETFT